MDSVRATRDLSENLVGSVFFFSFPGGSPWAPSGLLNQLTLGIAFGFGSRRIGRLSGSFSAGKIPLMFQG